MNPIPVKTVFFDAVGTLFEVKGSVGEVYLHYAQKYGFQPSQEMAGTLNAAFHEAIQNMPPPIFAVTAPEKLKQCERLWWFDVVHAVFYKIGMFEQFDDFFEEMFEGFGTPVHWRLFPETIEVLTRLKRTGFELGIISNFDTRFFKIYRGLGLNDFFDSVTISSLAGAVKPAKRIFQYALDQHGVMPQEAVHIGDHEQEDVKGAQEAGLYAFRLNRSGLVKPGPWTFADLSGVPDLLVMDR